MINSDFANISAGELRRAADIHDKIEALESELASILGGFSTTPAKKKKRKYTRRNQGAGDEDAAPKKKKKKRARRKLSPEALANVRAAQAKRWAKFRKEKASA